MIGYGMMGGFGSSLGFGSWGGVGLILYLVFMILVIAGGIALLVWLIRKFSNPNSNKLLGDANFNQDMEDSEYVLKVRYARGEITRDEYQIILNDLRSNG